LTGQGSKRQVLHKQVRNIDFRVYNCLSQEEDARQPLHKVSEVQHCIGDACGQM